MKRGANPRGGGGVNSCPEERVEQCTVFVPPASLQVVFNPLISASLWYAQLQRAGEVGVKDAGAPLRPFLGRQTARFSRSGPTVCPQIVRTKETN